MTSTSSSVSVNRMETITKLVTDFVMNKVLPAEAEFEEYMNTRPTFQDRWGYIPSIVEHLKNEAKQIGIWNIFLPHHHPEWAKYRYINGNINTNMGTGKYHNIPLLLSNYEYAPLAEILGYSPLASIATNCAAPDTGNMEVLIKYGNKQQQQEWLIPLLEGKIRSAFLMTEPDVASSDASNIQTVFQKDYKTNEYIINGKKWWSTGALHPNCNMFLVLGKVEGSDSNPIHQQHTILLVPRSTPGVQIIRPLTVFGYDDAPEGHAEIELTNVRVPFSNVILGEGKGFEISQGRLGPGRVHHCMRAIGLAERCHLQMLKRVTDPSRVVFGRPLWQHATIQSDIAENRINIDTARQMVLHTAKLIDEKGAKGARKEIAGIKVIVPRLCLQVIDRAIQAHGGAGVSQDTALARAWAGLRTLRIADGPDIVHIRTMALLELKDQLKKHKSSSTTSSTTSSSSLLQPKL